MRFPVVLFDLDGTVIDSGPMIVSSMKHAARSVLGQEIPDEVLKAAVGGPGLLAQMHELDPERVPELMFEVVSPDRESRERNYVKKRKEYRQLGVLEYVISDRIRHRVTVYTASPQGYRKRVLGPADVYTSPLLPGLAIPLAGVL